MMSRLQGLEIIFRVGLAILQYNQTDLIQLDMEGMSQVSCCSFIQQQINDQTGEFSPDKRACGIYN